MLSSNSDVEGKIKARLGKNGKRMFISLDGSFAGMSYVPAVCQGGEGEPVRTVLIELWMQHAI